MQKGFGPWSSLIFLATLVSPVGLLLGPSGCSSSRSGSSDWHDSGRTTVEAGRDATRDVIHLVDSPDDADAPVEPSSVMDSTRADAGCHCDGDSDAFGGSADARERADAFAPSAVDAWVSMVGTGDAGPGRDSRLGEDVAVATDAACDCTSDAGIGDAPVDRLAPPPPGPDATDSGSQPDAPERSDKPDAGPVGYSVCTPVGCVDDDPCL
jgi:hypothetical protein